VLAPGWAIARAAGLGETRLERLAIGAALGRVLFALLALGLAEVGLLPALAGAAVLAALAVPVVARRTARAPGAPAERGLALAALASVAAALLLVVAVVARSGLEGPRDAGGTPGDLLFYGRDSTHDPAVYAAMALRLAQDGLPLTLPFAGGRATTATYVPYAVLAGVHGASGADMLDVAFRAVPAFDAVFAALAACALAARLGAGAFGAGAAGVLLALGSEASFLAAPLGALAGRAVQPLDSWALFGPYLLAFNPIAPALGAWLAAGVLLAAAPASSTPRRAAVVAGLLVASLFETKLFLWAPAIAGLAGAALLAPAAAVRTSRIAFAAALLGSLPSLVEKAIWARRAAGASETGFHLCAGCLPRYLADAAWGSHELAFTLFREARAHDALDPAIVASTLGAGALVLALVLGARLAAAPAIRAAWRAARPGDAAEAGRQSAVRAISLAALAGLVLSFLVVVSPHYLNGAQFAWSATFGLWPLVGVALGRWREAARPLPVALVLGLALPSSAAMLARLGFGAPPGLRVSGAERELLAALARAVPPGEVVLEPSMLESPDRPSPVPWIAGRPVYLSLLSAVQSVPAAEREARFDRLVAVYAEDDAGRARAALAESGARFLLATPRWTPRWDFRGVLEPIARSEAGTLYRVERPPPAP